MCVVASRDWQLDRRCGTRRDLDPTNAERLGHVCSGVLAVVRCLRTPLRGSSVLATAHS